MMSDLKEFQNSCHLCLRIRPGISIFSVYENEPFRMTYSDLARNLLDIEIISDDYASDLVCNICVGKLTYFHEYKKECKIVEGILAEYNKNYENLLIQSNDTKPTIRIKVISLDKPHPVKQSKDHQIEVTKEESSLNQIELIEEEYEDYIETPLRTTEMDFIEENLSETMGKIIDLNVSFETDSPTSDYQCELCNFEFTLKENFQQHCIEAHDLIESLGIETPTNSIEKTIKKQWTNSFKCNECGQYFSTIELLREHYDIHLPNARDDGNFCDKCGRSFCNRQTLKTHKLYSHQKKTFKCDVCDKWFQRPDTLKVHYKRHQQLQLLKEQCDQCGKLFIGVNSLRQHQIDFHRTKREYTFQCDICQKKFLSKKRVAEHMIFHSSNRPFECDFCGKRFHRLSYVTAHRIIHLDARNYHCQAFKCGKTFKRSIDLKKHMLTHRADLEYQCTMCEKIYTSVSGLKNHQRKHCIRSNEVKKHFT